MDTHYIFSSEHCARAEIKKMQPNSRRPKMDAEVMVEAPINKGDQDGKKATILNTNTSAAINNENVEQQQKNVNSRSTEFQ